MYPSPHSTSFDPEDTDGVRTARKVRGTRGYADAAEFELLC